VAKKLGLGIRARSSLPLRISDQEITVKLAKQGLDVRRAGCAQTTIL
jgi:hypothetical protein